MSVELPRAVQHISPEQIDRFAHLTSLQILTFLEEFRVLHMTNRPIPPIPEHLKDLRSPDFEGPHWAELIHQPPNA